MPSNLLTRINQQYILIAVCVFFGILQFWDTQAWTSAITSLAPLKQASSGGVDLKLYYPLGTCDDSFTHTLATAQSIPVPEQTSPYLAGLIAVRNDNWQQAEMFFEKALANEEAPELSVYAMGVVQAWLGKDPIPYWRQGRSIARLLKIGDECVAVGNGEKASEYYRAALEALEMQDHASPTHAGKLVKYFAKGNDEVSFQKSLALYLTLADPVSLAYHWTLGRAFSSRKETELAIEHLRKVAALTPDEPSVWYEIGRTFVQAQEYDAGREALSRAIELSPESSMYYVWMGHSFLHQQQHKQAAVWYEYALILNPEDSKAVRSLAQVRMMQERYPEAYELYIRLTALDNRAYVRAFAAEAAAHLQNRGQALRYINEALALEPDNLDHYRQLAQICEEMTDIDCMKRAYQNILYLAPTDASARQRLDEITGGLP